MFFSYKWDLGKGNNAVKVYTVYVLGRLSGVFLRLCYKNQKAPKRLLVQKLIVILPVTYAYCKEAPLWSQNMLEMQTRYLHWRQTENLTSFCFLASHPYVQEIPFIITN